MKKIRKIRILDLCITLASSELAPNMFGASLELAPNMFEASSEPASVMEFGTN